MLELKNISRSFGGFNLSGVSFFVERGDYFILLGPSGSGKSLLLEIIAGLIRPDHGSVLLNGQDITRFSPKYRKTGLVFQDYALFPHMTVRQNIGYSQPPGLRRDSGQRIKKTAERLEITSLLDRMPETLSGGEMQRVALARTLVQEPLILLLDEPMSSVDTLLRPGIRRMLSEIHQNGQTIIHVTHDYEEALALATRIAVIDRGKIHQTGSPGEVFHQPVNSFIASFVGVKNFFQATLSATEGEERIILTKKGLRINMAAESTPGQGFVLVRGEDILLSHEPLISSATNNFSGRVKEIVRNPSGYDVTIEAGETFHALITARSAESMNIRQGRPVWLHFKATAVRFIPS